MTYIQKFMKKAIFEAQSGFDAGEIPVGCVIVKDNKIIASATNQVETDKNPTNHAEILCIQKAINVLGEKYLTDCEMYVTLEPCPMCMGAIMNSRIKRVYIGANDENFGACGSKYDLTSSLNHKCEVYFGILEEECKNLLLKFFKKLRAGKE